MSAIDPVKMARYARTVRLLKKIRESNSSNKEEQQPKKKEEKEEEPKKQEAGDNNREKIRKARRNFWRMQGRVSAIR